ncbi:MAG: hypothetical protein QXO25_06345 [Candidatus Bathyarchaeia archaeon]
MIETLLQQKSEEIRKSLQSALSTGRGPHDIVVLIIDKDNKKLPETFRAVLPNGISVNVVDRKSAIDMAKPFETLFECSGLHERLSSDPPAGASWLVTVVGDEVGMAWVKA